MFCGEVDLDDVFGDADWRGYDEGKRPRDFFVHVDDGEAGFFAEWGGEVLYFVGGEKSNFFSKNLRKIQSKLKIFVIFFKFHLDFKKLRGIIANF